MATIRRRGDSWQAQVRRRGRTVSKSFIQKTDAQRWAYQTEIEAHRRGLTNDRKALEQLTVGDLPRTIPLSFEARRVIVELAIAWAGTERIFPTRAEAVKLAWKRLTKRAKIADLHFHDLRHEAVSQFFERGLSIPEVALISGHKDPRMLFRYTHLKAEDVARKLNGLD